MTERIEWPTLVLLLVCSATIIILAFFSGSLVWWLCVPLLSAALVLHSSLQHEALHGHPFKSDLINELLVSVPFGLFVPYQCFRDSHLKHHIDENLTDPFDDPESNYLDPAVWHALPRAMQQLLQLNNTLAGRMLLGPMIGLYCFYRCDFRAALSGNKAVRKAYVVHAVALFPLLCMVGLFASLPLWAYVLSAYGAMSLLRVRTYLEHRADTTVAGRTVVIEDTGLFAFLFLNNNYHLVHHMHPKVAWYQLPSLYRARREFFLKRNNAYVYPNYRAVFTNYFFRRKDPVPHPLR